MRGFNVGAFAATHSVSNVANAVDANLLLYDLHAVITHKGQSLTEVRTHRMNFQTEFARFAYIYYMNVNKPGPLRQLCEIAQMHDG
jgi:hypothetical protein